MKVAILAGGYGTRISEESVVKPKPMIEIGGKPMLWHIMKHYSYYGFNEFVILLGYKGYYIKEYFSNYWLHQSDVTIDTARNELQVHNNSSEDWKITLVDTGLDTMTGARVRKAQKYLEGDTFMLTYGDGLSDVNIKDLVQFHNDHSKIMTLTAIQPEGRFGSLDIQDNRVERFLEKPKGDGSWVNGGFFVCSNKIFPYLEGDDSVILEREPMEKMAQAGQLLSYKHEGFWKCMDTLRDKNHFNQMWDEGDIKWRL
jgi:glucose-1-phosphate cytidylyltransferase